MVFDFFVKVLFNDLSKGKRVFHFIFQLKNMYRKDLYACI